MGKSKLQRGSLGILSPLYARKIAIFTVIAFWAAFSVSFSAQTAPDLTGNWQGTVDAGRGFRIILQIAQADQSQAGKGAWQGVFYTMGVGGARKSYVSSLTLEGVTLRFTIPPDGSFDGKLGADGKSMAGTLKYGGTSYALSLVRATSDTAWAIPRPTDHMPPEATPEFEVATIKPTDPNWRNSGFHSNGRRISCDNETIEDIIKFAYNVHARQIVEGPGWLRTDKYDIDGVPDLLGRPNLKQMQAMYRGVLSSRLNLTLHHEIREISVYSLRVGKSGSRFAKSLGDPNGSPDQTFTRWTSQLIELKETNATLAEFSQNMGMVLDRPTVDQTGLSGRFDFTLRWTPEGAQGDDPNAPPDLFKAIQEQLGLKLEATKAPVDVLVIDHIDRPSPN